MEERELADSELYAACIDWAIQEVRAKRPEVKLKVYRELTAGQRGLFMFRVLHDHAYGSVGEFYGWISCLLAQNGQWDEIVKAIEHVHDAEMLRLLEETRSILDNRNRRVGVTYDTVSISDLVSDPLLRKQMTGLYNRFLHSASGTFARMADYIRKHANEFVVLE
ncbi:hypothetical protein [Paenibacillus nasutitermitis]|uniref:DUF4375 domain-containing protein n=1 Tax=Paenibacillus nasutitermitis TaxID=1652958 RepID=A0A917DR64_9BACL|nr:hypothetical protein [Paenibacillus nasutitermitis]GGD63195.1 hypothetical protein GCM10010911_21210 [Paenibacillus nasutitermitis]